MLLTRRSLLLRRWLGRGAAGAAVEAESRHVVDDGLAVDVCDGGIGRDRRPIDLPTGTSTPSTNKETPMSNLGQCAEHWERGPNG